MTSLTITLKAAEAAVPRRHAAVFLESGVYVLTLGEPAGKPSDNDMRVWTAWKNPERPWLTIFSVFSPGFNNGVPKTFGGKSDSDRERARQAFNGLPDAARTLTISPGYPAKDFGQPVLFYIDDLKDDDNRGGLTIEITRLRNI